MGNSRPEHICAYTNLFGAFIHVDVPCEKDVRSQILYFFRKRLLKLFVFFTVL